MVALIRVYLDTSALFAGIWSSEGGARMLLKLGEADAIQLLIGSQVLTEIEDALRDKVPGILGYLALLLDRSKVTILTAPDQSILETCRKYVNHPGDAQVLYSAWGNNVDFFVTLDRKHFIENILLRDNAPFPIGTPGDFLNWFRERTSTEG